MKTRYIPYLFLFVFIISNKNYAFAYFMDESCENDKDGIASRTFWSQSWYSNLYINYDLTTPSQMQNRATDSGVQGLNLFHNEYAIIENPGIDISASLSNLNRDCQEVQFKICNEQAGVFDEMISMIVYNADPFNNTNVQKIQFNYQSPSPLDSGECAIFNTPIDNPNFWDREVYIIINDSGNAPTPLDWGRDFPTTNLAECNYENNLVSMEISMCPEELEICDNGTDDDDDGLIDYLDPDCPCNQSTWDSGLDYLPYSVNCENTFTIAVARNVEFRYQWLKDGLALANGFNPTLFIPSGNNDWEGDYQVEIRSLIGCELLGDLEVGPEIDSTYLDIEVCTGEDYDYNGTMYSPGNYTIVLKSEDNDCDSLIFLSVIEQSFITRTENVELCPGETYDFLGQDIAVSGFYVDTIIVAGSCDTIVELSLTLLAPRVFDRELTLCPGDSLFLGGDTITSATTLPNPIPTNQCDSFEMITVRLGEQVQLIIDQQICLGDSFLFGDQVITQPGNYTRNVDNGNSCPDLEILNLVVESIPDYSLPESISIIPGEEVLLSPVVDNPERYQFAWFDSDGQRISTAQEVALSLSDRPLVYFELQGICFVRDSVIIEEGEEDIDLFFPNAFSPNEDGVNDQFLAYGENVNQVEAIIFDRWGGLIHRSAMNAPGVRIEIWDGFINGKLSDAGVYTYFVKVIFENNNEKVFNGTVAIIK